MDAARPNVAPSRLISVRTMDWPLRLVTGLAVGQLLACGALIALRDATTSRVSVAVVDQHLVEMPLAIFLVSVFFVSLAWTYLLAGAFSAHWAARIVAALAFTAGVLYFSPAESAGVYALVLVLLAGVWALGVPGLAGWRGGRLRTDPLTPRIQVARFAGLLVLVLAIDLVRWIRLADIDPLLYREAFTAQVSVLSIALIPVLVLAGTDWAEWGQSLGDGVARLGSRLGRGMLLPTVTVLAGCAIFLALTLHGNRLNLGEIGLGPVAVALLGLLVVGTALNRRWHLHVDTWALALGAIAWIVFGFGVQLLMERSQGQGRTVAEPFGGPMTLYQRSKPPTFNIKHPSRWELSIPTDKWPTGPVLIQFSGVASGDPADFAVIALPQSIVPSGLDKQPGQLFATIASRTARIEPAVASGDWSVARFVIEDKALAGLTWSRASGNVVWLVYGESGSQFLSANEPVFQSMLDSFREGVAPVAATRTAASESSIDQLRVMDVVFWLIVFMASTATLVLMRRRTAAGPAGVLFLAVAGLLFVLGGLPWLVGLPFGVLHASFPRIHFPGIQAAIAVGTILYVAWAIGRRPFLRQHLTIMAALLALNIAVLFAVLIDDLYQTFRDVSAAHDAGRFNLGQAALILLALVWDVAVSGRSVTNTSGRWFPRSARVLLYLGYIMMVAATILYFSSYFVQTTGAALPSQFESEPWAQIGVVMLGLPLLITLFILKLRDVASTLTPIGAAAFPLPSHKPSQ